MQHYAAFHLGLHCLPEYLFRGFPVYERLNSHVPCLKVNSMLKNLVVLQVVVGGRNKYLINGSNANNTRVQDLFRSVQLNVNNPHFLIMQGRITKVLNMKPPEVWHSTSVTNILSIEHRCSSVSARLELMTPYLKIWGSLTNLEGPNNINFHQDMKNNKLFTCLYLHFQSKPLMNLSLRFFATVHSLMNDINLIDSCQVHLPLQYASYIKFIGQKWHWCCD